MSENKKIRILDLSEKSFGSLTEFFAQKQCEIVKREQVEDYALLDFILVDTEEEARLASKDFDCEKNEIEIVCLGPVRETKGFLLNNGRFCAGEDFAQTKAGEAALGKFLTRGHAVHLDDSFAGLFTETESFHVVNHLALGLSSDELALSAFEKGFNIVALRSFLDHAVSYFTYLKQAGLAGIPFEVESAWNNEWFAVNIHAPVKNFTAEYLLDSFGAVNSNDPIQYLLGVVARSCEFLDITHVEKPGRLVLSAFWSKSGARGGGGIAFNNIFTVSQYGARIEKKVQAYRAADDASADQKAEKLKNKSLPGGISALTLEEAKGKFLFKEPEKASGLIAFVIGRYEEVYPDSSINDMDEKDLEKILEERPDQETVRSLSGEDKEELLEKIRKKSITDAYSEELRRVRDNLKEDEDFKNELSDKFSEEVAKRVSGHLDADALNRVMGQKDDPESVSRIGGKEAADEFKTMVKGLKEDNKEEFSQKVGGAFESKAGEFKVKISSFKEDPKKGLFDFVHSAIGMVDDVKMDSRANSYFKKSAPEKIVKGLQNYALKMDIPLEELNEEHLLEFKNAYLPDIVEDTFADDFSIEAFANDLEAGIAREGEIFDGANSEFREKFRDKLLPKLEDLEGLVKNGDSYVFTDEAVNQEGARAVIEGAMKEAMEEEYRFSQGSRAEIEEKEKKVISELSRAFGKEEGEVAQIVKGASAETKEKETRKVMENLFKEKPGDKEKAVVEGFHFPQKESADSSGAATANSGLEEALLLKKLKEAQEENKKLQDRLRATEAKRAAERESREALEKINKRAKKEIQEEGFETGASELDKVVDGIQEAVSEIDQQAIQKLKKGVELEKEEGKKLAEALEREQRLLASAREAQTNIRRLEVEFQKKESLFSSELQRVNKTLKGKEALVEKIKESMQNLVEKKQAEIAGYKKQNEALNQRLKDDRLSRLEAELKWTKKEYESVSKVAEMYKSKVENMLKSKKKKEGNTQADQLTAENRSLSRLTIQLENKLNAESRNRKSLENQLAKIKDQDAKLRASLGAAEGKYRKALEEVEKLKATETRLTAMLNKKEGAPDKKGNKEVDTLKATNAQLQQTIKDMVGKLKRAASEGSAPSSQPSAKEKHLEQSVKKLNSELSKARGEVAEAKKQVMKMKSEAMALKNKIKQLEKSKGAAKKKAA